MFKKLLAVFVISFVLVGCGASASTVDTSSKEAFRTSLEAMSATLDDAQKSKFQWTVTNVVFMVNKEARKDEEKMQQLLSERLGGKTVQQIIDEYDSK